MITSAEFSTSCPNPLGLWKTKAPNMWINPQMFW